MQAQPFGALVGEAIDWLRDDSVHIPTGFPSMDRLLRGGLRTGHVALMQAGMGVFGRSPIPGLILLGGCTKGATLLTRRTV